MPRPSFRVFVLATLLLAAPLRPAETPRPPETPAERAAFRATPSYAETGEFLAELAARSGGTVALTSFGLSAEGRTMPLLVVSADGATTPERARELERPVVLVLAGIHAGEIDGKDALLALLRDFTFGRRDLAATLGGAVLLVVPIYNVDGHERVSPWNRPNQDGPVLGMGFRTTTTGLDLNRDFVKLETPEARALAGLVARWRPHLVVDTHVTDGSDHDWTLTWSWVEAPQLAPPLDAWMRAHLGPALGATEAAGHRTGPYVDLVNGADPAQGFSSWVGGARYSTGYFPLRQRASLLVEMHSYKPYEKRVRALEAFLGALLAEVGKGGAELVAAAAQAEAEVVAKGLRGAVTDELVLAWRPKPTGETIRWPVYDWHTGTSIVTGEPLLDYRRGALRSTDPRGLEVPWVHRSEAERTVIRPRGYLVLPGWPQIEETLAAQGIRTCRLEHSLSVEVETLRVEKPELSPRSYQGRHAVAAKVVRTRERVHAPEGSLWVPADQPDFELAAQLLEPDAPDSLFAWGLLSSVLERKEYIERRVLEAEAKRRLAADPALEAEWRAALADPAFAADPRARFEWWWRHTPYWDTRVGQLPVLRVMVRPAELAK
jgi:hypothetical protein